jgi:hypothetical protein
LLIVVALNNESSTFTLPIKIPILFDYGESFDLRALNA